MKKFLNVKTISLLLAVVLLVGGAIGGTLAWIIDSQTVTNTFTYGDINIELEETQTNEEGKHVDDDGNVITDPEDYVKITEGNTYEMIPGSTYLKDPAVTVFEDSEACWLFVKVTPLNGADTFLAYAVDDAWATLDGVDGVYYREVAAATADTVIPVLEGNQVTVKTDIGKDEFYAIEAAKPPQLQFTAYAIQRANLDTAADAWAAIQNS